MALKRRGDVDSTNIKAPHFRRRKAAMFTELPSRNYVDQSKNLRASSDAVCPRKFFVRQVSGLRGSQDIWSEFFIAVGNTVHDWVYKILARSDWEFVTEFPYSIVVGDVRMKGFIDLLARDTKTGRFFIVDIKTVGHDLKKPSALYNAQLAMYGILTEIDDLAFLQVPRAIPYKSDFVKIPYQKKVVRETLHAMAMAITCWNLDLYPPPGGLITSYEDCQYCPLIKTCWSGEELDSTTDYVPRQHKHFLEDSKRELLQAAKDHRAWIDKNFTALAQKEREKPKQASS